MKTIATIIHIRSMQIWRILKDIGLLYGLLVSPLLLVALLRVLEWVKEDPGPLLGLVVIGLLLTTHFSRKDAAFLKGLNISGFQIYSVEYSLVVFPLSLLLLLVIGDWLNPLIMQLGALAVALVPQWTQRKSQYRMANNLQWIPLEAFEWRSGLRPYRWWLLLLLPLALVMSYLYIGTVLVIVLIMSLWVTSFYNDLEGKELLETIRFRFAFFPKKLQLQALVFHSLLFPFYLIYAWQHWTYWYLLPVAIFLAQLFMVFSLYYKYANYAPGRRRVDNQMLISILFISMVTPLSPIILPGALFYLFLYRSRSLKNIDLYYAEH